jgi:hypothetical protein
MANASVSVPSLMGFAQEIRHIIYEMLLVTSRTFQEDLQGSKTESGNEDLLAKTTSPFSTGRFNLSPNILLVNKQVCEEAKMILCQKNKFIRVDVEKTFIQTTLESLTKDYF